MFVGHNRNQELSCRYVAGFLFVSPHIISHADETSQDDGAYFGAVS